MSKTEYKNGDPISWLHSVTGKEVSGKVVERVRARVKPKFEGKCVEGLSSKREVSYIVAGKSNGAKYWITLDSIVEATTKTPKKVVRTAPQPIAEKKTVNSNQIAQQPVAEKKTARPSSAPRKAQPSLAALEAILDTPVPAPTSEWTNALPPPSKEALMMPRIMPDVFKLNFDSLRKHQNPSLVSL